jgi:uncharacterized membrane protein
MDRMIAVVFDNKRHAYQAKTALRELDSDATIALHASALVWKHADGTVTVDDKQYAPPLGTLTAPPIGSLLGLAGGPAGLAAGAMLGLLVGALVDNDNARVGEDLVADVARALSPKQVALIAQLDEECATSVEAQMEAIGATVFRGGT